MKIMKMQYSSKILIDSAGEEGAEDTIWTSEGENNRRMEKTA
jgi:hypothetical protein